MPRTKQKSGNPGSRAALTYPQKRLLEKFIEPFVEVQGEGDDPAMKRSRFKGTNASRVAKLASDQLGFEVTSYGADALRRIVYGRLPWPGMEKPKRSQPSGDLVDRALISDFLDTAKALTHRIEALEKSTAEKVSLMERQVNVLIEGLQRANTHIEKLEHKVKQRLSNAYAAINSVLPPGKPKLSLDWGHQDWSRDVADPAPRTGVSSASVFGNGRGGSG